MFNVCPCLQLTSQNVKIIKFWIQHYMHEINRVSSPPSCLFTLKFSTKNSIHNSILMFSTNDHIYLNTFFCSIKSRNNLSNLTLIFLLFHNYCDLRTSYHHHYIHIARYEAVSGYIYIYTSFDYSYLSISCIDRMWWISLP